jgi:hypothetical protein
MEKIVIGRQDGVNNADKNVGCKERHFIARPAAKKIAD